MARTAHPTDVFTAIAEPRRREVIAVLTDGREYPVNEIVLRMKMAQPAVSKHLGVLRQAGVVTVVRRGQHRMYRLNAERLKAVHDWVTVFERYWRLQVGHIRQRAEHKALERRIRLDGNPNPKRNREQGGSHVSLLHRNSGMDRGRRCHNGRYLRPRRRKLLEQKITRARRRNQ